MQELSTFLINIKNIEKVRYTLLSKGVIIIKFTSEEAAKEAISKINLLKLKGKKLEASMVIKITKQMMTTINERVEDSDEENC